MRVKVLSEKCTLGPSGSVVDVDETVVNVRALIRGRHVEPAPEPKTPKRKAATSASKDDD